LFVKPFTIRTVAVITMVWLLMAQGRTCNWNVFGGEHEHSTYKIFFILFTLS